MTKVASIEVAPSTNKIPKRTIAQILDKMYEGACNADGSFKRGWQPPGQWYVRTKEPGKYTIVHNLERIDYSVSVNLLGNEPGTVETNNLTNVSFDITITRDSEPINLPFRFALNTTTKNG